MKKTLLITAIAFMASFASTQAQNVTIPDVNFKAYLVGNPLINTNLDTEIQLTEAAAFNGTINCASLGTITDLTGISAFTALTTLNCNFNLLTGTLDLSANTALTNLNCGQNQLTSLNVTNCTNLLDFRCYNNLLTSIDVSTLVSLNVFYCSANQLTALNVNNNLALSILGCYQNSITALSLTNNTALTNLSCSSNLITSLNLINNTSLTSISCGYGSLATLTVKNGNNTIITYFEALSSPNLTCIEVDNAAYSTANWTNIDGIASFNVTCGTVGIADQILDNTISIYPNPTTGTIFLSDNFNIALTDLTGKLITKEQNTNSVNISNQPSGMYFLLLTDSKGQIIKRSKVTKE